MGWWEADNQIDLLGDGPADTLSEALEEIAKIKGRKPTLQNFLDALRKALLLRPAAVLLEGDASLPALVARLNDGQSISSRGASSSDKESVRILYQAIEDIATEYEDMEDHRKPRLSEVLATAAFILGPDRQGFVETPTGSGVDSIEPALDDDRERGRI